jgi:hypothetical protein
MEFFLSKHIDLRFSFKDLDTRNLMMKTDHRFSEQFEI